MPLGASRRPARSATTKSGYGVQAHGRSSYGRLTSPNGCGRALDPAVGSNGKTGLRTPIQHASAREASLAHARALLIYLKHRGVLNIDEFRRTNPWPVEE